MSKTPLSPEDKPLVQNTAPTHNSAPTTEHKATATNNSTPSANNKAPATHNTATAQTPADSNTAEATPKLSPEEKRKERIRKADLMLLNDLNQALQHEEHKGLFAIILLLLLFCLTFLVWAYNSPLEEVTRGQGSVIPSSRDQVVQSLDPGILQEMRVKEGDIVEKDQILLTLDDTRAAAIFREVQAKVYSLEATTARLRAEAYELPLTFEKDTPESIIARETTVYKARQKALNDSLFAMQRSKRLLDEEIAITDPLVKRGMVSKVELLRMQRQSSELDQQIIERRNRYATEASAELNHAETELAQARENLSGRADPLERSQLRAPLRGVVKNIRITTVGGVIQAGQNIMEIVPLDDKLIVQAYISPKDVAFIRLGQTAIVKISAYDYAIYGGIEGTVTLISPDTLQDDRRPSELKLNPDQAYYRVLVETTTNNISDKTGRKLPITPGMTAQVDIKTGQKTVFQYLIKPITRMKQALQER